MPTLAEEAHAAKVCEECRQGIAAAEARAKAEAPERQRRGEAQFAALRRRWPLDPEHERAITAASFAGWCGTVLQPGERISYRPTSLPPTFDNWNAASNAEAFRAFARHVDELLDAREEADWLEAAE